MTNSPTKYNAVQVALHWLTALLVIVVLAMGQIVLVNIPNASPEKIDALKGHMIFGAVLMGLIVVRVVWRKFSAQPARLDSGHPLRDKLGVAAHHTLYLLVFLVAATGTAIAIQSGMGDVVFDGVGSLPDDFSAYPPRLAHGILTKLLMALVAAHFLAALYHQFALKDGIFKRMWFGKGADN